MVDAFVITTFSSSASATAIYLSRRSIGFGAWGQLNVMKRLRLSRNATRSDEMRRPSVLWRAVNCRVDPTGCWVGPLFQTGLRAFRGPLLEVRDLHKRPVRRVMERIPGSWSPILKARRHLEQAMFKQRTTHA
jgi:hypothetical protein